MREKDIDGDTHVEERKKMGRGFRPWCWAPTGTKALLLVPVLVVPIGTNRSGSF